MKFSHENMHHKRLQSLAAINGYYLGADGERYTGIAYREDPTGITSELVLHNGVISDEIPLHVVCLDQKTCFPDKDESYAWQSPTLSVSGMPFSGCLFFFDEDDFLRSVSAFKNGSLQEGIARYQSGLIEAKITRLDSSGEEMVENWDETHRNYQKTITKEREEVESIWWSLLPNRREIVRVFFGAQSIGHLEEDYGDRVSFGGNGCDDEFFRREFPRMKSISKVAIGKSPISGRTIRLLCQLHQLTNISITNCPHITAEDIQIFSGLSNLSVLQIFSIRNATLECKKMAVSKLDCVIWWDGQKMR